MNIQYWRGVATLCDPPYLPAPWIVGNVAVRKGMLVRHVAGDGTKMCGDFSRTGFDRHRLKQASMKRLVNAKPWCPLAYVRELAR